MATGISLHIGLNFVDTNHYNGWDGELNACENDARDMQLIAKSQNFKTSLLLREKATRLNILKSINQAANKLKSGDIFYISYSGHGGQLPDFNNDEPDGKDETWCLYDGQLVDDELKEMWTKFELGVRVFVTSDSCHSGSIIKNANNRMVSYNDFKPKYMGDSNALSVYNCNKEFYDKLLSNVKKVKSSEIKASVILISGCQDNQYSYDGTFNGTFTAALKRIWNGGKFDGSYEVFHKKIETLLPAYQTPNFLTIGKSNLTFKSQKPYTI